MAPSIAQLHEIECILLELIEVCVLEHNAIAEQEKELDFSYQLKIDFAPLIDGVSDYLEHTAYYGQVIGDEELKLALSSG